MDLETTPVIDLEGLRRKWGHAYDIWRGVRSDTGEPGDYVASRMDDSAGPDPTVMSRSAGGLDHSLREQQKKAAGTWKPKGITPPWL